MEQEVQILLELPVVWMEVHLPLLSVCMESELEVVPTWRIDRTEGARIWESEVLEHFLVVSPADPVMSNVLRSICLALGVGSIGLLSLEAVVKVYSPSPDLACSSLDSISLDGLPSDRSLFSWTGSVTGSSGVLSAWAWADLCARTGVDPAAPGAGAWLWAGGGPASPDSSDLVGWAHRERRPHLPVLPVPVLAVRTVREEGPAARRGPYQAVRRVSASWGTWPPIRSGSPSWRWLVIRMTGRVVVRHYPHISWWLVVGWMCTVDYPFT